MEILFFSKSTFLCLVSPNAVDAAGFTHYFHSIFYLLDCGDHSDDAADESSREEFDLTSSVPGISPVGLQIGQELAERIGLACCPPGSR